MDVVPKVLLRRIQFAACVVSLIVREKLAGVGGPGNREQRKNQNGGQCFHDASVGFDYGQKGQGLAHFRD